MRIVTELTELQRGAPTVLTIGAFDGVHRGHQWLIGEVSRRAKMVGGQSMVLTFDPRPLVMLRPGSRQLTTGRTKQRLIAALEPDLLAMLAFTRELSAVPAGEFLDQIVAHVNLAEVWVGNDFAFGHNREGTVDYLIKQGDHRGFDVHVVARRRFDGEAVSSTRVRDLLQAGDIHGATALLGHKPGWEGRVIAGHGRGREMGFPTANIEPPFAQQLPALGIYVGHIILDEERLPAAISVGTNPVFQGTHVTVEAHILDWDGDLRDRTVGIEFVERIRDERDFPDIPSLLEEMYRDCDRVREVLGIARSGSRA